MIKKILILVSVVSPFVIYYFYMRLINFKNKKYPVTKLAVVSIFLLLASLGTLRYYDNYSPNIVKPEISLKPIDVLTIQLNALQRNNIPFKDAGIEQVWEFAHPNNKKMTGPLENFKKMIYSQSYKILLAHINSEITVLSENINTSVYKVVILSKDKKKYSYIWQIDKVREEDKLKDCWMTSSVSGPEYLGEVI